MTESVRAVEAVQSFLRALDDADPDASCKPPGQFPTLSVGQLREGLDQGVIAVHRSGWGFTWVLPDQHGWRCREGHPCELCRFQSRLMWEDRKGGPASQETRARVMQQVTEMSLGRRLGGFER